MIEVVGYVKVPKGEIIAWYAVIISRELELDEIDALITLWVR